MKKPTTNKPKNDHLKGTTGWCFNNEIQFNVNELIILRQAKDKHVTANDAFQERLGSLDEIREYINRRK